MDLTVYESKVDLSDVERNHSVATYLTRSGVRIPIELNFPLTAAQLKVLTKLYPQFRPTVGQVIHGVQHPILNASRIFDEYTMYEMLNNLYGNPMTILDVGGNTRRANQQGRRIHCCNPILDQADGFRMASRPFVFPITQCNHKAEDCDCLQCDAAFSSHSLYYLSPLAVYRVVAKTTRRVLIASVHSCFDGYGNLFDDGWYLQLDGKVQFYAKNGGLQYEHPSINWLLGGGYHVNGDTLCWSIVQRNEMSCIVVFTIYRGEVPYSAAPTIPLPIGTNSATIRSANFSSWERFVNSIVGRRNDVTFIIPDVVYNKLRMWCRIRPHTPDVYAQLMGETRRLFKDECELPLTLASDSIAETAELAWRSTLDADIASLSRVASDNTKMEQYNSLLKFQRPPYQWKLLAGCVVVSATALAYRKTRWVAVGSAVAGLLFWFRNRIHDAIKSIRKYYITHLGTTHRAISSTDFRSFYSQCVPHPTELRIQHIMCDFTTGRSIIPRLPVFPPKDSEIIINLSPIDINANIFVRERFPDVKPELPVAVYGIINTMAVMPGGFDRSHATHLAMLRRRMLLPHMKHDPAWDAELILAYRIHFRENDEDVFGPDGAAAPLPVHDWINKFAEHQATFLRAEELKAAYGDTRSIYDRSVFYKREFYTKITRSGWTGNRPRGILAGAAALHLGMCSATMGEANYLKRRFHPAAGQPWTTITGASPSEMGIWHDENHSKDNRASDVGDDSNFDNHHHDAFLTESRRSTRRVCNVPGTAIFHEGQQRYGLRGYIKGNIRIEHKEAMMPSGNVDTYNTNTKSNIGRKNFIYACWLMKNRCLCCEALGNFPFCPECRPAFSVWATYHLEEHKNDGSLQYFAHVEATERMRPKLAMSRVAMAAADARGAYCGDDSLIEGDADKMPTAQFANDVSKALGFDYKCKILLGDVARYEAEFCSGLFWPTKVGSILSLKLGRWTSRQCWWMDLPRYDEKHTARLLLGDAIGRLKQCHFVPFARKLWARIVKLLGDVDPIINIPSYYKEWVEETVTTSPSDEAWQMVYQRYGLTREHEDEYEQLLERITSLPAIFNYPPMLRALEVDAIDDEKENPLF